MENFSAAIAVSAVVVGLISVIAILSDLYLKRLKLKARIKQGDEGVERMFAHTHAEIAQLRDRVQVLERLATDSDVKLSREIGELGERPSA